MILTQESSICEQQQKLIISKENGREHRADNRENRYNVRHYHLDGGLIKQRTCCDYLLLNDSNQKAYFIELKGRNVKDAVSQLEAAVYIVKDEIPGYEIYFRIIGSKMKTHEIDNSEVRRLKDKYRGKLEYTSVRMEEKL